MLTGAASYNKAAVTLQEKSFIPKEEPVVRGFTPGLVVQGEGYLSTDTGLFLLHVIRVFRVSFQIFQDKLISLKVVIKTSFHSQLQIVASGCGTKYQIP